MTVEHRDAPGLENLEITLADNGHGPVLRLRPAKPDRAEPEPDTPEQRILHALDNADAPLSQRQIRERAATRPATVAETLKRLVRQRRVERAPEGGYRIADQHATTPAHSTENRDRPETLERQGNGNR